MITEQDLLSAITECQGERDPDANTCKKLAAYYIIYNQLFGVNEPVQNMHQLPGISYSMLSELSKPIGQVVTYKSDTEFSRLIQGKPVNDVFGVIDDLMSALWALNPRLYDRVMSKLDK